MARVPFTLRTQPAGVMRRILSGCQVRDLVKVDGIPMVVISPLQFVRPRRTLDGSVVFK